MTGRLEGEVAIITGASRGIGEAAARAFAREGASVVLASRKQASLDDVVASIEAESPGRAHARACHTGDAEQIAALVAWTAEHVGAPTVLLNNAATNPFFGPMVAIDDGAWRKTFEVNVDGYFHLARAVVPYMLQAGGGSIINVASIAALMSAPMQGAYGMTKAAVVSMTRTMALELGGGGIRVNALCPGLVETKLASALTGDPNLARMYTDRAPLGRWGQPDEIAGPALFLASRESSYMTGQVLVVDGGYTIA